MTIWKGESFFWFTVSELSNALGPVGCCTTLWEDIGQGRFLIYKHVMKKREREKEENRAPLLGNVANYKKCP